MFRLTRAARRVVGVVAAGVVVGGGLAPVGAQASGVTAVAPATMTATSAQPSAAGAFASLAPARLLDTRSSLGGRGPVPSGGVVHLSVLGRGGVPASGVSAVVLNVTVVYPKSSGYVTVWPDGTTRPTASNLNFVAGQVVPNLVVAKVGANGAVALQNSSGGTVQLLADVSGYYRSGSAAPMVSWQAAGSAGPLQGDMSAVSCATTTFCLAVDHSGSFLTFDGATWSAPTHVDSTTDLVAVSCPATTFCAAVDPTGHAMTFNGTTWTTPVRIDTLGAPTSVSCASSAFCAAVDDSGNVVTFDGATWSAPRNVGGGFSSISCASSTFCDAVGGGDLVTLRGTTWTTGVLIDSQSYLTSISCPSASFCAATDDVGNALRWAGTTWTTPTAADPPTNATSNNYAWTSVSCAGPTFCVASNEDNMLTTWDGTSWQPPQFVGFGLMGPGVSCATQARCVVLGYTGAYVWDGTSWTDSFLIDRTNSFSSPTSVSCPSTVFCDAVDDAGAVVTWDGTAWSPPRTIDANFPLTTVSCASATFCAAGDWGGSVSTWDGTSWTNPTSLPNASLQTKIVAISCASATFCVATGTDPTAQGSQASQWNGTTWSPFATIDSTGSVTALSCPSATFCVAVDTSQYLTWNGATWSAPRPIGATNINALSCTSASFCIATEGSSSSTSETYQKWDGSRWSPTVQIPGMQDVMPLSCVSSTFCVGVGSGTSVDANGRYTADSVQWDGTTWSNPVSIAPADGIAVSCPTTSFCMTNSFGRDIAIGHL